MPTQQSSQDQPMADAPADSVPATQALETYEVGPQKVRVVFLPEVLKKLGASPEKCPASWR